jgi:hypothetical protein
MDKEPFEKASVQTEASTSERKDFPRFALALQNHNFFEGSHSLGSLLPPHVELSSHPDGR